MEKIFSAFLSKTLNIDESKLSELVKTEDGEFKPEALNKLLELDATRVQGLKTADETLLTDRFNNGYAKAKQEVFGNFENQVREQYKVSNPELKGLDLINAVVQSKVESLNVGDGNVTDNQVLKHPVYLDMTDRLMKEKSEVEQEWSQKFTGLELSITRNKTMDVVNAEAMKVISNLNPVFSEDSNKAHNQRQLILTQIGQHDFEVQNNRIVVLDKEGKPMEDAHRVPLKFDDMVSNITTTLFDLHQQTARSSSGGQGGGTGTGTESVNTDGWNWNKVTPQSENEFMSLMSKANSLEEKTAITNSWTSRAK